ncbi:type 1 glutamine amidotransferase domain-containing protein [Nocardia acidivorans]|uniref:type 1 glutamine amidotransferase domain-containing protein n=1 Tax=Nocardia acidivorans TaxID=404580 RepID=UPI00082AFFEE|nr:type 1 glutamine amidotransferase domain-containing protein [Nocardia acidivorans]
MPESVSGARVLILTSNSGVEHDELIVPRDELRARGADVTHAAPKNEAVHTYRHDLEPAEAVQPDAALDDIDPSEFDLLVVPGGTVNADKLRTDTAAQQLARAMASAGRPIAAICHGPWLLIDAGLVAGKTLTSYHSVHTDISNAGGAWVDEPVVRCDHRGWLLITSRSPADLPDFVDAATEVLAGRGETSPA